MNAYRNFFLFVFTLFVITGTKAQIVPKTTHSIKANAQGVDLEIQFYSPGIVRVVKTPEGQIVDKQSLSVIKIPEDIAVTSTSKGNVLSLQSADVRVDFDTYTGRVSFFDTNGNGLFTEKDYGVQFTPFDDAGNKTFSVRQAFLLDKNEVVYGLGQQQNGRLNQRNQKIFLRQDNMKVAIPYFISVKGYTVFWDNYSATTFTDNRQETSFDSEVGNCADYYFMYGGDADATVAQMRALTGQVPLMPLWVFGFNQSRERYKNQFELTEVVKKYRELKVPLDGIIQDWQYWGKDSNWNAMSFDPASFPRPKAMADSVHKMNARLFIVAWPGVGPHTPLYKEFKDKKMLIDFETWPPRSGSRPYDVYNPAARDIYWEYMNKGLFSAIGNDAWWLDSSEPDHINIKDKDFDQPTYLGTYRSVVNAFPLMHVGGVYTHQRNTTSAKRVSILTRSAFAGQQRYGANTWSGDVPSTWEAFQKQIPAALNFSLTGIPYWNADIGGFFAGHFNNGGGAQNPEFQDLYTRWMQFAAFTPMMRSHGTDVKREIYQFGNRGEWAFDVQEKYINLRYSLLPYIYASARDVTARSGSFMRALFMDFKQDTTVYNISGEYLFGRSFLVAPVTEKNAISQNVYLPAGANWYDFWTNDLLKGSTTVNKQTPHEIIPLYIKAGAIIPWGPKVQYAMEKKWDNLEIRIYPGADADFTLYEDEGDNYNYEKGAYTEIDFHWNDNAKTLTIADRKGAYSGMLVKRKFNIVIAKAGRPMADAHTTVFDKTVSYNGKAIAVRF